VLKVPIDKILPVTEARSNISKLVDDVEKGNIYVLTRGGRPSCVLAPIEYIKKLEGDDSADKAPIFKKKNVNEHNDLIENSHMDSLPNQTETAKLPDVVAEKSNDVILSDQKEELPTEFKEPETELVAEEDEPVPIKISTGNV
jgi:prevent-host-death family protein